MPDRATDYDKLMELGTRSLERGGLENASRKFLKAIEQALTREQEIKARLALASVDMAMGYTALARPALELLASDNLEDPSVMSDIDALTRQLDDLVV